MGVLAQVLTRIGNGPNTVSQSTVSNTELSEFFVGPHRVLGRELSESSRPILFMYKNELTEFLAELTEFLAELSQAQ